MSGWTKELREEVFGLHKSHSAGEISAILHRRGYTFSRNAIIGLFHRAGMTKQTIQRPRVPKHLRIGAPTGSIAFKIINGIKKQKLAARPGIDPEPFQCQDAADVIPLRLSLSDLERADGKCRWPYDAPPDEPGEGSFRFCGHPICSRMVLGRPRKSPYCLDHAQIASGKGTESERRAAHLPSGVAA